MLENLNKLCPNHSGLRCISNIGSWHGDDDTPTITKLSSDSKDVGSLQDCIEDFYVSTSTTAATTTTIPTPELFGSKFKGLSYIDFHGVKVLADDECAKYTDAVDQSPATIALTALLTQLFPKEGLVCRCRSGPGQGKVS